MVRGSALLAVVALLGTAPYQCKSEDPAKAREETPGEALWQLCGKFAAERNDAAARATLDYLIERYPSSRMTARAKDERGVDHPCAGVAAEASAAAAKASSANGPNGASDAGSASK